MCKFKMLEYSPLGYVAKCESCKQLQLAFGNIVVRNNEEQFHAFCRIISKKASDMKYELERDVRNIYLESPCRNVMMVFNLNELEELSELLECSMVSLEIGRLLEH